MQGTAFRQFGLLQPQHAPHGAAQTHFAVSGAIQPSYQPRHIMVMLQPRNLFTLQQQRVSTGCPQLDQVLGGGLPCGSLTEVTGELAKSLAI